MPCRLVRSKALIEINDLGALSVYTFLEVEKSKGSDKKLVTRKIAPKFCCNKLRLRAIKHMRIN